MKNSFEEKALYAIKKYSMLSPGDCVLVGLSGGKDSASLLYFLAKMRHELKITPFAFHLNHMIRGHEAERDESFSELFAKSLGVEFVKKQIDIPKLAQNSKRGLEETARDCRYELLAQVAGELGCNKIATAHTMSDNCETVISNLIRGSGRVKGIPPVRNNIIRPLIYLTSADIIEYCSQNAIKYVFDSTNDDNDYTRNFIRNKIVPLMHKLNPSLERTLMTPTEVSACDSEYFDSLADEFISSSNTFELKRLQELAGERKNTSLLYAIITKLIGGLISSAELDGVKRIILSGTHGKTAQLPNNFTMTISYDRVSFSKKLPERQTDFKLKLSHGENRVGDSPFGIYMSQNNDEPLQRDDIIYKNINKKAKKIFLYCDKIIGDLYIRRRAVGDSIHSCGITRSVKKYMIDSKIPMEYRDSFPIVCDDIGIVWVPGLLPSDRVKNGSGKRIYLSLIVY